MKPYWFPVLTLALLATACAAVKTDSSEPTEPAGQPQNAAPEVSTPIRMDTARPPFNTTPPPLTPGAPREMPAPGIPPKVFRTPLPFPQPGDAHLQAGKVYLTSVEVAPAAGGKVLLALEGNLPTPCHQLRVAVERRDKRLDVRVYSVTDPQKMCSQVLKAFSAEVKMGPFPDEAYQVFVNGQAMGVVSVQH